MAAPGGLVKGGAVQCSWVDERLLVFLLVIQFADRQNKHVSFQLLAHSSITRIIIDIPSESLLSTGRSASIAAPGASVPTSTMRKIKQMFNKDDQRLSSSSVNYGRVRYHLRTSWWYIDLQMTSLLTWI